MSVVLMKIKNSVKHLSTKYLSHNIFGAVMPSRKHLANAIRALSMDAVQKAKSGHPGAPMGMADIAEVLWRDFLKAQPK